MSFIRSGLWFSLGTFASRLTGLLRESVMAGVLGAGILFDAFVLANRLPNLFRELLAEGALGSSFTKVFASSDPKDREGLFALSLLITLIVGVCLSIAGWLAAPYLGGLLMLGCGDAKPYLRQLVVNLTSVLFPFIGLMMLSSIVAGALHEQKKFLASSFASCFLNMGYIAGALVIAPHLLWGQSIAPPAVLGISFGVLLGGAGQLLWQYAFLGPYLLSPWRLCRSAIAALPQLRVIRDMVKMMLPMVLAASAVQVNVVVNSNFAATLETGAVSWLNLSLRLLLMPVGVIAVALASVSLPTLSFLQREGKKAELAKLLKQSTTTTWWLMSFCATIFYMRSQEIITIVYHHGAFSAYDSHQTAKVLQAYSLALVCYGLIKVLTPYYYASNRTTFAMRVALLAIIVNFLANAYMAPRYGAEGLAYSTAIVTCFNAAFLLGGIYRDGIALLSKRSLIRSISAVFFSIYATRWIDFPIVPYLKLRAVLELVVVGISVALVFFALYKSIPKDVQKS